jgi:hypothetical protein
MEALEICQLTCAVPVPAVGEIHEQIETAAASTIQMRTEMKTILQ